MSVRVCLALAGLLVALSGPLRAAEPRELTILASAYDSPRADHIGPVRLDGYGGIAIRGPDDLAAHAANPGDRKALEAELAKILDVDGIDWTKQMVLAVRGEPGTKADRIHFDSLRVEGGVLTVSWTLKQRPPHAGAGTPIALVLVERVAGEVKFGP
jgi:hypothetical protein